MLYVNMHFIVTGLTFLVTMYGQSFPFCTQSIRRVLGMSHLINHLPTLFPEVHALTRKELDVILVSLFGVPRLLYIYITIVDFTKSTWILDTFSYIFTSTSLTSQS